MAFIIHFSCYFKSFLNQIICKYFRLVCVNFYIEFLFWSSIFWGDDYWSVFMVLISLSLVLQLLTFVYQLLIVSFKAKTFTIWRVQGRQYYIYPLLLHICTCSDCNSYSIVYLCCRRYMLLLCSLGSKYWMYSLLLVLVCTSIHRLEKKKSTNNFIYRGEINEINLKEGIEQCP